MPVLSCACMFMLSEAGLVFSCFASNAKKNPTRFLIFFGSHILHRNTRLSVATPWDQLLGQTDGQTVPLSFSSQPTNPTSQIAGLIKCRLLQGSVWFLWVRCHSQCMMQQLQTKGSSPEKKKNVKKQRWGLLLYNYSVIWVLVMNGCHLFICHETVFCVTQLCSIFYYRYNKISGLLGFLPRVLCENVADTLQRVAWGLLGNSSSGCQINTLWKANYCN